MAQVPDAELLTAAMRQELPCGPTDNIDGEPGSAWAPWPPRPPRWACRPGWASGGMPISGHR